MIIRTITCHHSFNHGAMLQAYALLTYLQSLGHDAKVIDYRPPYMPDLHINFNWVPSEYNYIGIKQLYRLLKLPYLRLEQKRRDALERFFNDYISITDTEYQSIDDLKSNPPEADLYISGSDQIWNTTFKNGSDPAFYLDFGSPKRKISYAASFATSKLELGTEPFVKNQLGNLDSISVREASGKKLLSELGYDGTIVVDPVFLLTREQWDMFDNTPQADEGYILIYDFEKKGSSIEAIAKRLARLADCKVYSVSPFKRRYADKCFVDVGPDVFVSLVKHAQCVISNSFHGTAFSMIYEVPFFVVNRKDGLNVRMKDLLCHYGLTDRLITPDAHDGLLMSDIYYAPVQELLVHDIEHSKSYLSRQIELAG